MKSWAKSFGIIAVLAVIGFSMTGCMSVPDPSPSRFPAVSDYTFTPSKGFVVVGAVVLREVNERTLTADLMERAIAMGGHDFINLRLDWQMVAGEAHINTASAIVIRYTDETLVEETTTTVMIYDGVKHSITTERRYVGYTGRRGGAAVPAGEADGAGGGRTRGFLGRHR